jgi:general secretion pathway protein D
MNRHIFGIVVILVAMGSASTWGQTTPAERRAFREYTSPQELVSIAPTTPLDKALSAISEVSQKFVGKIIIDTERRSMVIGTDIQGMQWRDALEQICRKNDLWYTEFENYIQITSQVSTGERTGGAPPTTSGGPTPAGQLVTDIQKEPATFRSREIRISAFFFEVNLTRSEEVGINWNFAKSTADADIGVNFVGADNVGTEIFKTEITPKVSFATMSFLLKLFSNYKLGEVLSSPQIIVRSGEEGRIQVGQDFSVRERDFAGNLIDRFYSAGTIVKVTPQVITEQGVNFIRLKIQAERSSVAPGQVSTIINKTQANTDVLLLDGEETLIGGLYDNETNTTRTGVPFLKDLPWYVLGLRYLFGYDKDEVIKKELVILLKTELVPTLQERVTQRKTDIQMYDKWRTDQEKKEKAMMGGVREW